MDFETTLQIRPKLGRAYFGAAFFAFWLIMTLVVMYPLVTQENLGLLFLVYAIFAVTAGWELRKCINKILSPEKYSLRIGPGGLFHFRSSKEPLPWNEVGDISSYKLWGKTMIRIQRTKADTLSDQNQNNPKAEKSARLGQPNDYLLDPSLLKSTPEDLMQTIRTHAKAWRNQIASI
ncbi:hypothetical protein [Roseibium sp. Sym1]|uniref:hypothetical protein n=1 Tax=Roseibium sp. Sym1 TaxID=3016006 RepID=UPI0022B2D073|nr:hypothetical protein [Roseibium sp. Sym1]